MLRSEASIQTSVCRPTGSVAHVLSACLVSAPAHPMRALMTFCLAKLLCYGVWQNRDLLHASPPGKRENLAW